ncbi:MAG: hypothetical protein NTU41_10750 [Chloroflexi bacterium]|nr:hypothetical protein [Chloroflexota bacterium]
MRELQDYSGEFLPDLKMGDFSKDAMVRAWQASGKLYIGMYGVWLSLARELLGEQKAWEMGMEIWRRIEPNEIRWVRDAFCIPGNDVATFFKIWQVDPGFGAIADLDFELKDGNHGILTARRCLSLGYAERHNDPSMAKLGCDADVEEFMLTARLINPKMNAVPLKLPPRRSKDEIACQWKVWIEP